MPNNYLQIATGLVTGDIKAATIELTGAISASNISGSISGTNTGDVTLATFGSSPNANGASLSGQILTLQPANATSGGGLSTTTQTIAGQKTFSTHLGPQIVIQDVTGVFGTNASPHLTLRDASTLGAEIGFSVPTENNLYINNRTATGNLYLMTNATIAITINSSQNTTIAGSILSVPNQINFAAGTFFTANATEIAVDNHLRIGGLGGFQLGTSSGDLTLAGGDVRFQNQTPTTATYFDAARRLVSSTTTPTQLAYLDIATGRTGTGNLVYSAGPTLSGQLLVANGTTTNPSIGGSADTNTGVLWSGGDDLELVSGGSTKVFVLPTQVAIANAQLRVDDGTAALPAYSWSTQTNMGLLKGGTDQMAASIAGIITTYWGVGYFGVERSYVGSRLLNYVKNTNNSNGLSDAAFEVISGGASGGDALVHFVINGVTDWAIGIDNSDSDSLVFSQSNTLGTNNYLKITTAGIATFSGTNLNTPDTITMASGSTITANSTEIAINHLRIGGLGGPQIATTAGLFLLSATIRFSALTANTAVFVNVNKDLTSSTTTDTQLAYLDIATGRTGTANLVYSTSPTITTPLIVGVTDGSNATAGNVGETQESTVSSFANLTTNDDYNNVTNISLTAGDWLVGGSVALTLNGATGPAESYGVILDQSAGNMTGAVQGKNVIQDSAANLTSTQQQSITIAPFRFSTTTTRTVYLKARLNRSTGTAQAMGHICAVRIR